MDGSSVDFIVLPLVILPVLAFWIGSIHYADSHPVWRNGPSDVPPPAYVVQAISAMPEPRTLPAQRTASADTAADAASAGDPATRAERLRGKSQALTSLVMMR